MFTLLLAYFRSLATAGATSAIAPFNIWQRVLAPANFQGCYFFHNFCLFFPANDYILHLSIETSKKGTGKVDISLNLPTPLM